MMKPAADPHGRVLSGTEHHEDAFVLAPTEGRALLQSVDILSPLGNDPRRFGQTAAANALSDIYAMGGEAYSALNILSFKSCDTPLEVIAEILHGAAEKTEEAGAVPAGGHTLEGEELRFGLSVTGTADPKNFAQNCNLQAGDVLVLTKRLGTGVLSTGIKAGWEHAAEAEDELFRWTTHLNRNAGSVLCAMGLKAATDITGFGLGGHALEMAQASRKTVHIDTASLPFMQYVLEYAADGLIPQGSYANRSFAAPKTVVRQGVSALLHTLAFDAQTSGGLLLAVPEKKLKETRSRLADLGEEAFVVGSVSEYGENWLILE